MKKATKYIATEEYLDKYQHLTLNIGDIVSSCSGASWGKTAIWDYGDTVMLNTSTLRLRFLMIPLTICICTGSQRHRYSKISL